MLTFLELVKLFYPQKTTEEQEKIARLLEVQSTEFYPDSWNKVKREQITLQETQLNLLRTVYQFQFGYYNGVASEILSSIEKWTEGVINFKTPFEEVNNFYEWLYAYLGFQNFSHLSLEKQVYLLGSRFIFFAINFNIPVFEKIQEYFSNTCDVDFSKQVSHFFSTAIHVNKTPLDLSNGTTIQDWITKYELTSELEENKLDKFVSLEEVKELNEDVQLRLFKILELFDALKTDSIWRDIKIRFCVHGKLERNDHVDTFSRYLEFLAEQSDIMSWLQDFKNIASWIKAGPQDYWKSMMKVLQKKIDLKNEVEVDALSQFLSYLEGQKLVPEGILSFNETDDQFHWNEELIK